MCTTAPATPRHASCRSRPGARPGRGGARTAAPPAAARAGSRRPFRAAPGRSTGHGRGRVVLDPAPRKHGAGASQVGRGAPAATVTRWRRCGSSSRRPRRGSGPRPARSSSRTSWRRRGRPCRARGTRWFALAEPRARTRRSPACGEGAERGVGRGALARMVALRPEAASAVAEELVATGARQRARRRVQRRVAPRDPLAERLAGLVRADRQAPRAPDALARRAGADARGCGGEPRPAGGRGDVVCGCARASTSTRSAGGGHRRGGRRRVSARARSRSPGCAMRSESAASTPRRSSSTWTHAGSRARAGTARVAGPHF